MSKKILFLEDLYNFYSNNYKRSVHYSSDKTGKPIVVQMHANIQFDENGYDSKAGLTPVHLMSCHIGENLNGSNISEESMREAMSSFQNRPILAFVHEVNGQLEFYTHNMHEDEDGNIVYDEKPVGVIPESCNAQLVYHEDLDKTYLEVDGYLYDEYSPAVSILEREKECACSIELFVDELSFDAKEKHLNLDKFHIEGVTILGKTPSGNDVKPGMEGSNIKLKDFSVDKNSMFSDLEDKICELQDRLDKLMSACSDIQFSKEGGNLDKMKFQELLEKYNKTIEDIDFDYENMSDEELEQKFAELFDDDDANGVEDPESEELNDSTEDEENDSSDADGENNDSDDDGDGEKPTQSVGEPPIQASNLSDVDDSDDSDVTVKKSDFTVTIKYGEREFALSLQDKIYALYDLVNATYADADNTWYGVQVFDDYVIMEDWCASGKYFKQNYSENDGVFTLVGDRVSVFAEFVTADELKSLEDMRANYEALVQFKAEHEKKDFEIADETSKVKIFANVNKTAKQSRYGDLFKK